MYNKDYQRGRTYEAIILMGLMCLLTYVSRLWPLLLLTILGLIAAVIRLLVLSRVKARPDTPVLELSEGRVSLSQADQQNIQFRSIQSSVSQILGAQFPDVRWIWENPRAKEDFFAGSELFVLMNRAGGYRRARVVIQNLQVTDVIIEKNEQSCRKETSAESQKDDEKLCEEEETHEVLEEEDIPEDFGLIAFQWVESHILLLNDRCNNAIGSGADHILLPASELPGQESWEEICKELARNDLPDTEISEDGIEIKI